MEKQKEPGQIEEMITLGDGQMPIKLYICPECHNANETPGICCERVSGSHQRVVRNQRQKDIENLRVTIKVLEREDREIELQTARAHWAIKQQQVAQIASAIDTLMDSNMSDAAAMEVAEKILSANIGP